MKLFASSSLILLLGPLLLAGCGPSSPASSRAPAAAVQSTNQRLFVVKGIVKAVHPERKEIEIKHEAIPDYMPAMTMPFDVKDTNLLAGIGPGQSVSFRLVVTDTDGWVDQITSLSPPSENAATNTSSPAPIRMVEPLKLGETLPAYHLTNELGQPIATTQYNGDAVAITFLFTRCPFPTFCPRLANDFTETQDKLLNLQGGPSNWHLLTISIDPEYDQPAVLKAYAEAHHYDPAHWSFATGDAGDIAAFGDLFGLAFWRDSTGSVTHNMRTAVIDAHGRLQKVFEGKDWTSAELAAEIVQAAKR